ncbi:hypothetical protein QQ045_009819 [Rhodiola kirilowii]
MEDFMSTVAAANGLGLNPICLDMVTLTRLHQEQSQIDQHIFSQYEGLRLNIQEQRKRDLASILNRIDSTSRHVLAQKDEEIARAKNRAAQLELILHTAKTEHNQWQNLALEKEAQVINLNKTINQMLLQISSIQSNNDTEEDAESCCDVGCSENRVVGLCRGCGCREACVVLLPCRHLCSCVLCESVLQSCPVCRCLKQGAIEALLL